MPATTTVCFGRAPRQGFFLAFFREPVRLYRLLIFIKLGDENSAGPSLEPDRAPYPIARIRSIAKMGVARRSALLPLLSQIHQRSPNRSRLDSRKTIAPGLSDKRLFRYRPRLGLSK